MKCEWLAFGIEQQVVCDRSGCCFAAIEGLHFGNCVYPLTCCTVQQKRTTTNATGLRLNQAQHHLHGNRCINRRAACFQHIKACLCGQGIGRSHRKLLSHDISFACKACGYFGLQWRHAHAHALHIAHGQHTRHQRREHNRQQPNTPSAQTPTCKRGAIKQKKRHSNPQRQSLWIQTQKRLHTRWGISLNH